MAQPQPQQPQQPQPPAPPLPPITPSEALDRLRRLISDILLKNTTLINYYIYPQPVPTEIAAYEPRLKVLESRINSLNKINLHNAVSMIDGFLLALAQHIFPILPQLFHACTSFQQIFIEYYDRRLEESLPYEAITETIRYCHDATLQYIEVQKRTARPPVETQITVPPGNQPSLCPGAISFMNRRDRGKVSNVGSTDYLPRHHDRLADSGGVVLWWNCNVCAFRLRYHASASTSLNINSTDEVITEKDTGDISYRCAWLVKSHIYHPPRLTPKPAKKKKKKEEKKKSPSPESPPPPPAAPAAPTPSKSKKTSKSRLCRLGSGQIYIVRKRTSGGSSKIPKDKPDPPAPPPPPKEKEKEKEKDKEKEKPPPPPPPTPDPLGPKGLRYFCAFCIVQGLPLSRGPKPPHKPPPKPSSSSSSSSESESSSESDSDWDTSPAATGPATCFATAADLIEHVDDAHNTRVADRPVVLLLRAFGVALGGSMGGGPEAAARAGAGVRWDLDLR